MVKISKPRVKKSIAITTIMIAMIIGVVVLIIKMLNSPAEGIISQTASPDTQSIEASSKPKNYSDKYISFTYPANFEIIPSQKSGNFLDVVKLSSTDHTSKQIAIAVVREDLTNDSGINFRIGHPEIYKKKSETPTSVTFTKSKNGPEQTGYIQHNDLVISISITANSERDLNEDYQTIADTLEWKQ